MATVQEIYNEINRIENAKSGIAGAIEEKGVEVPAEAKIDAYPGLVRQIQQGDTSDCVKFTPQTLTEEQKAQARENIGAGSGGGDGKMGVISQTQTWTQAADGGYDYAINPASIVRGLVPNYFITMWELRGGTTATFNENTGYFEYLDLTDISYEEAKVIYSQSIDTPSNEALTRCPARAILPFLSSSHFSAATTYSMMSNSNFESVFFGDLHGHDATKTSSAAYFMYAMFYIKTVQGILDFSALAADVSTFYACFSLVTIKIKGLKANMSFRNSSRLSLASVVYMVDNATNTSAITITMHATAYARCQADTTEYTYQGNTYTGIIALATAKNITIASA